MAVRDDSVIRGSLIACMIFLVLSIALNAMLWMWGDRAAETEAKAKTDLQNANNELQTLEGQVTLLKAMIGFGGLTEAEFERMKESVSADPQMAEIESQYVKDMAYLGDVGDQNRNYKAFPEFFVRTIRLKNESVNAARDEVVKVRDDANADVDAAIQAKDAAETKQTEAEKKLDEETKQFAQYRDQINLEKEQTRDALTKKVKEYDAFRAQASKEKDTLSRHAEKLQGTIDTQKIRLNELQNDRFETTQGEIRYVYHEGHVVTINLGSADDLRTGVTFGVIDGDETRLQDAKVKATIQVTQIRGDHLAEARVVARPEIEHPIIPGDFIYSPFWAPGRRVKIALAGDIDIDGDGRPDNSAIKGMILAAGAEVAAEVSATGQITGKLDPTIRFLVVGEPPELADDVDLAAADRLAQSIKAIGVVKAEATEKGLTIIPAWKLQNYLKIMDNSLTTPLGSAARAEDFQPDRLPNKQSRMPTQLPRHHTESDEGIQKDNKILPP